MSPGSLAPRTANQARPAELGEKASDEIDMMFGQEPHRRAMVNTATIPCRTSQWMPMPAISPTNPTSKTEISKTGSFPTNIRPKSVHDSQLLVAQTVSTCSIRTLIWKFALIELHRSFEIPRRRTHRRYTIATSRFRIGSALPAREEVLTVIALPLHGSESRLPNMIGALQMDVEHVVKVRFTHFLERGATQMTTLLIRISNLLNAMCGP